MAAQRRVVAELGRPETPEETAERRATARRFRIANQTTTNLVIAVGATLLIVAFLIIVVVRPDQQTARPEVDWRSDAAAAQADAPGLILSPVLPDGWSANRTSYGETDDTATWTIGFLTPSGSYLALEQGFDATGQWLRTAAAVTDDDIVWQAPVETIDGRDWWVLDRRDDSEAPGNHPLVAATTVGAITVVLHGTASRDEIGVLVEALGEQFAQVESQGG